MSEEEKELVEKFQNLYIKEFNNEPITSDDRLSYIECALITNLIEELDKELNNLKEIEQLHQEENGKLRVELEQEKEKNKEAEKQGYIKGSNATHEIWKEIIKERLEQNKAKTDCTYCNNTCDSYAVCMFCKEILEGK